MATLSTLSCVTGAKNTGRSGCFFDPKNFLGVLLCPPNFVIPAAQLATLQAYLVAQSEVDSKALRIYPVADFFDFKDNSEAPVVEKFGYGQSNTVRDGVYDWAFRYRLGGLNLSNRLRTHNGSEDWYMFIDSKNQIVGTSALDSTGAASIGAIPPIEFYADPFKPNDGKKTSEFWINFRFLPKYINEQVEYITDAGFDVLSAITGLKDVVLTLVGSATPGTYNLTMLAGDDKTNLVSLLGTTALNQVAAYKITNFVTGATITLTTATANGTTGVVALAVDVADPDYPTTGLKLTADLVGPTELAALTTPIVGYESTGGASAVKN
jgi:hypothetical protein